jgi:hypothetical protein
MSSLPNKSVFMHAGGGFGNTITEIVRGVMSARLAKLDGCCLWWRTKNPRIADIPLSSVLDIDFLAKESGLSVSCMTNKQGWDFIHEPQVTSDTTWEKHNYWYCAVAYDQSKTPNYFLVPTKFKMSACRKMDWDGVYKMLRPSKDLSLIIDDKVSKMFKGRVLGVHVRRTDRWREARVSSNEAYFKMIDKVKNDYDTIFLATDDPDVERQFSARYGDKLVHTGKPQVPKWSGFKTRKALVEFSFIQDAVIDIWMLSRCDSIIGSFKSSFSKVAARISTNPNMKYYLAK